MQARALQQLRPGEFSVISGDRPILEFRPAAPAPCHSEQSEESATPVPERSSPVAAHSVRHSAAQSILVHPSPWNGKENWHGAAAAHLAGLILLRRGEKNALKLMSPREAVIPSYSQIFQTAKTAETIRRAAALLTRMLESVPIWRLTTHQVPDSTQLLLGAVFSENP
ncbi:MAG: hypothetical protein IKI02_02155 [Oscillospiraceae bacterium]|nr:hypothetical protein [Oscillospiraceae bacterium]